MIAAGEAVLGPRALIRWEPRTLRTHPEPGMRKRVVREQRLILEGTSDERVEGLLQSPPAGVAVEGWGLGDAYPDTVGFLCAREPAAGGADFLVDGAALLASFGSTDDGREPARLLSSASVVLRTHPQHPPQEVVLARRSPKGRAAILYAPSSLLPRLDETGEPDAASRAALRWNELVLAVAADAPRFDLRRDEALLVDNYRMYHGRDGYLGDREVYRGWFWTDTAFAYPMVTEDAGEP